MNIPRTMRAAVYRGRDDLRVETVPVPRIRSDELLVKVACCGVCPSDIKKIQAGTLAPPRIFGHETAGTIVRVGAKVRGFRVGQRVGLHHHVPCRECHFCRHHAYAQCPQYKKTGITAGFEPAGGGFAEYVRVMGFVLPGVVPLPPRASFVQGAMLEPVNTVLKGIACLGLLRGDAVLVAGQGPIGLLFTRVLHRAGMNVWATDLIGQRHRLALDAGAKWAGPPDQLESCLAPDTGSKRASHAPRHGLDAAIITVPADAAVIQAHRLVRGAGKVLLFGHTQMGASLPVDPGRVCMEEKALLGSYSADIRQQTTAARFCFGQKQFLEKLVSHQLPLEQVPEAVRLAATPSWNSLKIMIRPDSDQRL